MDLPEGLFLDIVATSQVVFTSGYVVLRAGRPVDPGREFVRVRATGHGVRLSRRTPDV